MLKSSPLYEFLKSTGVLETGDKERILDAKKLYRKQYLTQQKQRYRKTKKHIAVILEEHELIALESQAKHHGLTLPQYIKQSALHYQAGLFLVPHANVYLEIKELVYAIHRQIQEIQNKEKSRWYGTFNDYDYLKQVLLGLLPQTEKVFSNPLPLVDAIEQQLKSNKDFRKVLYEILEKYDT